LDANGKTVEFHKHEIMFAYNIKSNADLVLFALKRGLIADIDWRHGKASFRSALRFPS